MRKIAISLFVIGVLIVLAGCNHADEYGSVDYVERRIVLISGGVEFTHSGNHFLHASNVGGIQASGPPFEHWLRIDFSTASVIRHTYGLPLQILVEGTRTRITTSEYRFTYFENAKLIPIYRTDFTDGVANVLLPDTLGIFLLYVDLTYTTDDGSWRRFRYVFKVEVYMPEP